MVAAVIYLQSLVSVKWLECLAEVAAVGFSRSLHGSSGGTVVRTGQVLEGKQWHPGEGRRMALVWSWALRNLGLHRGAVGR